MAAPKLLSLNKVLIAGALLLWIIYPILVLLPEKVSDNRTTKKVNAPASTAHIEPIPDSELITQSALETASAATSLITPPVYDNAVTRIEPLETPLPEDINIDEIDAVGGVKVTALTEITGSQIDSSELPSMQTEIQASLSDIPVPDNTDNIVDTTAEVTTTIEPEIQNTEIPQIQTELQTTLSGILISDESTDATAEATTTTETTEPEIANTEIPSTTTDIQTTFSGIPIPEQPTDATAEATATIETAEPEITTTKTPLIATDIKTIFSSIAIPEQSNETVAEAIAKTGTSEPAIQDPEIPSMEVELQTTLSGITTPEESDDKATTQIKTIEPEIENTVAIQIRSTDIQTMSSDIPASTGAINTESIMEIPNPAEIVETEVIEDKNLQFRVNPVLSIPSASESANVDLQ